MEKEILLEHITSRLEKMNICYDSLEPAVQKYLVKIEEEISNRFTTLNKAIETIAISRININTISKSGAISNKTVYKYEVLTQYIKLCEEEFNSLLPGGKEIEKALREKLGTASDIIRKMDRHTVDVEMLKAEIDQLKEDASDDAIKIANLTEENMRLSRELQSLRKNHPEIFEDRKSTIVAMPGVTLN